MLGTRKIAELLDILSELQHSIRRLVRELKKIKVLPPGSRLIRLKDGKFVPIMIPIVLNEIGNAFKITKLENETASLLDRPSSIYNHIYEKIRRFEPKISFSV